MFLQVMNDEEKARFLELVYKVASIDGEYAQEEQEIVNSYKNELGIYDVAETGNIDELISYFSDKNLTLKKIVLFEIIGLINADDKVEAAEASVLVKIENAFGLDKKLVDKIDSVIKKLQNAYDEVYDVLFD